jgi:hypothetical protein
VAAGAGTEASTTGSGPDVREVGIKAVRAENEVTGGVEGTSNQDQSPVTLSRLVGRRNFARMKQSKA